MQLTVPNVFANGTGEANIIDAPKMNANFDQVETVLNGNIEADNIKTGSAIAIKNITQTISAVWTFSSNPSFNAGGIADAALTANIPKKDATGTFSAKQSFDGGIDMTKHEIEQPVLHKLASAPGSPSIGQMYYNTADNKFYGWNGTSWQDLSYTGGYTGGAVSRYSAENLVDSNDSSKLWFKTEGATPTVKIAIKGERYPVRFYTELGQHTHVFTGTAHTHTASNTNHTHSVDLSHGHTGSFGSSSHTHDVGGTTGSGGTHTHGGVVGNGDITNSGGSHTHSFADTSGTPSGTAGVGAYSNSVNSGNGKSTTTIDATAAEGTNANAGVNGGTLATAVKNYADALQVWIDGTNVTSDVLSATGWSAIGDGTDTHAFHTTGTGEMNASAWKSYSAGFHTIEIIEPTAGKGCRYRIHIETY